MGAKPTKAVAEAPRADRVSYFKGPQDITGTLDPHLVRYPDDEWAQVAAAQLTGVRATLAQLAK
ncbi:hypothetical protein PV721_30435 [Streptomyces sp. MB09-01]|uniref:hypothetical protein n=1 Tax=Streptomyces sp. MB09-01 TaxID=3028666 RepID=UPI0029A85FBD|nr:hypothetical protein [Streptomyces sp. MB09-01]MDX3538586.1 hypothetical protein [Streptomyces sp. MB09-01]